MMISDAQKDQSIDALGLKQSIQSEGKFIHIYLFTEERNFYLKQISAANPKKSYQRTIPNKKISSDKK